MVEQAPEGGYQALAVGHDIFTEPNTLAHLYQCLCAAVHSHFEPKQAPSLIRLHVTRAEVLTG